MGYRNHKDVFLYNKAHLRQNVTMPLPEAATLPRADGMLVDLMSAAALKEAIPGTQYDTF